MRNSIKYVVECGGKYVEGWGLLGSLLVLSTGCRVLSNEFGVLSTEFGVPSSGLK